MLSFRILHLLYGALLCVFMVREGLELNKDTESHELQQQPQQIISFTSTNHFCVLCWRLIIDVSSDFWLELIWSSLYWKWPIGGVVSVVLDTMQAIKPDSLKLQNDAISLAVSVSQHCDAHRKHPLPCQRTCNQTVYVF